MGGEKKISKIERGIDFFREFLDATCQVVIENTVIFRRRKSLLPLEKKSISLTFLMNNSELIEILNLSLNDYQKVPFRSDKTSL